MRNGRRGLAAAMALAGIALLAAAPAAQEEVRTQSELFGFDLEAQAAPLSIRFFEDFIPIPTDPGDPQMELTASHSSATLGTGPIGRAVASSIWPGPAFGDGFGTIVGDEEQEYPVRANATYPGRSEEDWQDQQTIEGVDNFGMHAVARGLDIAARSEGGGLPGPAEPIAAFGQIRSEATSTVTETEAIASSLSSVSRLVLLEGVIVLHDVTTEMTATSDGESATSEGRTNVGAIQILGQRARLTGDGVEIVPEDDGGDGGEDDPVGEVGAVLEPVNQAIRQLTSDLVADGVEETLGIHIEALDQQETIDAAIGKRVASGVKVTINLAVLRGALQPIIDLAPLGDVLDLVPDDDNTSQLKGLLFELLGLGTKMEVIVGRGLVATSASPPFELPDLPPPPPPPATGTGVPPAPGLNVPPPTGTGAVDVPAADVAPPQVSSPEAQPPALAATEPPDLFDGIPLALAGVLLLLTAVPTYGLSTIREAAVGVNANVEPPRQLPDLRGGT